MDGANNENLRPTTDVGHRLLTTAVKSPFCFVAEDSLRIVRYSLVEIKGTDASRTQKRRSLCPIVREHTVSAKVGALSILTGFEKNLSASEIQHCQN